MGPQETPDASTAAHVPARLFELTLSTNGSSLPSDGRTRPHPLSCSEMVKLVQPSRLWVPARNVALQPGGGVGLVGGRVIETGVFSPCP